jgi:AcrR family transcriptional regulator
MTTTSPRTRLDPDQRRDHILEVAGRVFSGTPYAQVSLGDVAREAGVSRSLVSHYFGSKRGLFMAVMRAFAAAAPAAVRTDRDLPLEQTVDANVAAWLDFAEEHGETTIAFAGIGALGRDAELQELVEEIRDRVVDRMLLNHLGTTDVPREVRIALRAYTGLYEVAVSDWLHAGRVSREEVRIVITRGLFAVLNDVVPALLDTRAAPPSRSGAPRG